MVVLVVLVMLVAMLVNQMRMEMGMLVPFPEQEPCPAPQEEPGRQKPPRELLAGKQKRQEGAREGGCGEVDGGARRPLGAKGVHEEDDARPVTDAAEQQACGKVIHWRKWQAECECENKGKGPCRKALEANDDERIADRQPPLDVVVQSPEEACRDNEHPPR